MKWNNKDIKRLIKLHKSGLKTRTIADQLNRTVSSVSGKINMLQQRGQLPYKHKGKKSAKDIIKASRVKKVKAWESIQQKQYKPRNPFGERTTRPTNPTFTELTTSMKISALITKIESLLLLKNKQYGDSALAPIRVFSKADGQEQIKVRIDDKLNRLLQGDESIETDKDVIMDLIGYLILLLISMDK
jgi:hypothetical protein|tara:strand:- start:121 stop:684 length:564 start_codon:yes stop_codon:yes gene_type:complete